MNHILSTFRPARFVLAVLMAIAGSLLVSNAQAQGFVMQNGAVNTVTTSTTGASPSLADLDGDGDQDLVLTSPKGGITFFGNNGTKTNPIFAQTASPIPPPAQGSADNLNFSFGDLDGDGDLDAITGNLNGKILTYINSGTKTNPIFAQAFNPATTNALTPPKTIKSARTAAGQPLFDSFNYANEGYTYVRMADFDADGDLDVLVITRVAIHYLLNAGSSYYPNYVEQTGCANPFNGIVRSGSYTNPVIADVDKDGDLDVALSGNPILYYRNVGSPNYPAFVQITGVGNPFNGVNLGFGSQLELSDLDGDGDPDIVAGLFSGQASYLKNELQFTQQPSSASQVVCVGSSISTSVQATGSDGISYQWYRDAQTTDTPVPGQNGPTLNLSNLQPGDAGVYYVRITGNGGSLYSDAFNLVVQNTFISQQPASYSTVSVGGNVLVPVAVSGPVTGYQWYKDGQPVNGQNTSELTLYGVSGNQAGVYQLQIQAGCGSPLVSNNFTLVVGGNLAIGAVTNVSCELFDSFKGGYYVTFTPTFVTQTSTPISFSVVNEKLVTTDPPPYTLRLYTDNPSITLVANQVGSAEARYQFAWLAACPTGSTTNQPPTTTGIADQTILQGQAYQLELKNYFSDPEQQSLSFSAQGLPVGLSLNGSIISGVPSASGVSTVNITAQDPGNLSANASFQLTVSSMPSEPSGFTIVGVSTVSCEYVTSGEQKVTFTPQYGGVSGSPISFSVVGEKSPTTDPGPYSLNLYTDNPVITLSANQNGVVAQYAYHWADACYASSGRIGAVESVLAVKVLGNPVGGQSAEIEISGVEGQSVQVELFDAQGRVVSQSRLVKAGASDRLSVPTGSSKGVLLLRVSTSSQRQQVKLVKP